MIETPVQPEAVETGTPTDVRSVTFLQKTSLDQSVIDSLTIQLNSTGGVKTVAELKDRLHQHIHFSSLCATPVTVARLNRLFSRPAYRLGVTISALCSRLISEGAVQVLPTTEKLNTPLLVATVVWQEVEAYIRETMGEDSIPATLEAWKLNKK